MSQATPPSSPAEAKTVFITGAVTSLGRTLTRQLVAAGHRVIGTAANKADAAALRALGALPVYPSLFRAGELRSAMLAAAGSVDVTINLAPLASAHLPFQPVNWNDTSRLLIDGTAALVEAAKAANAKQFIHGSYAFAGAHTEDEALASVLNAVHRAEATALTAGIPVTVLRFGYIYGEADDQLNAVLAALKSGRGVPNSTDRHALAGWVNVYDAANAVALTIGNDAAAHRTLDIVDDHADSPAGFLNYLASTQHLVSPETPPAFLARLTLGAAQFALLNASAHPNNAEAKTVLGWQPRFATFKQGIDDMLLSVRAAMTVR